VDRLAIWQPFYHPNAGLLASPSAYLQELAAGALWNLGDIDANRGTIADAGGILPLIVAQPERNC
jgi:hypothetical protein